MAGNVYITALQPGSGKSAVVLGATEMLARHAGRLAFYRPFIASADPPAYRELLAVVESWHPVRARYQAGLRRLAGTWDRHPPARAFTLARTHCVPSRHMASRRLTWICGCWTHCYVGRGVSRRARRWPRCCAHRRTRTGPARDSAVPTAKRHRTATSSSPE